MAPRLLLILLVVLPGGCAGGRNDDALALQRSFAEARAGLLVTETGTAAGLIPMPPGPTAPMPPAPFGPRPATAAQLLGARPDTVRRWLGEPALRRVEGSAEVWLYAGPDCALDLVLYPDRGGLSVAHAAARASGTRPRTEAVCLSELGRNPGPARRLMPATAEPAAANPLVPATGGV